MYLLGKPIKFIVIFFVFISSLYASSGIQTKNCDHRYIEIWDLYATEKEDEARKLLEHCVFSDEVAVDTMNLIQLGLLYHDRKYIEAIQVVEPSRERIIKYYNLRDTKVRENHGKQEISELYFFLIGTLGNAYYKSGDYKSALRYYHQYINDTEKPNYEILGYTGLAYNKIGMYTQALKYLKEAYPIATVPYVKNNIAYNIAAIYAKVGDTDQSMEWLKAPLLFASKQYIEYLQTDKDFKHMKDSAKFNTFLNSYLEKAKNRNDLSTLYRTQRKRGQVNPVPSSF